MWENVIEITSDQESFTKATNEAFKEVVTKGIKEYNSNPKELEKYIIEQANKLQQIKMTQEKEISPSFIDQATGYIKNFFNNCIERKEYTEKESLPTIDGRSFLWVDDNVENNILEKIVLNRLGVEIIPAKSIDDALSILKSGKIDLIISGIHRDEEGENNPNIGYELLDEVERIGKKIPLIFYTPDITLIDKTKLSRAYGAADALNELVKLAVNALVKV